MSEQPPVSLEQQLRAAFPGLTDADFGRHESDLYVVAYPEVGDWLRKNYRFHRNVTTFVSQEGSNWNGAGRVCYDIPFAAWDQWVAAKKS